MKRKQGMRRLTLASRRVLEIKRRETDLARLGEEILRDLVRSKKIAKGNAKAFAVSILSAETMERLRRRFLKNHPPPVTVLAFPAPSGFPHPEHGDREYLGEVYLARNLMHGPRERLIFFFIHGLLHLAGFGHSGSRDTMKMEALERSLRASLGPRKPGRDKGHPAS